MGNLFGIEEKVWKLAKEVEEQVKEQFQEVDEVCQYNSMRVLQAFQKYRVSDMHFNQTTGYGYGDVGRDVIEKIYADIFQTEDALVRGQFISGTHALTVTLFALLRPNDTMLSICGKPYDTLDEVIGIAPNASSLASFGIKYDQIDLVDHDFNYEQIAKTLQEKKIKLIEIQRSRGYATRKSITLDKMKKVIEVVKKTDPEVIVMVDNCYGEFVEKQEPTHFGADIVVGSLIKNLGGGISPNGAYVAGKKDLVDLVAERLTSPGQGKEVGPSLGANKSFLQGMYMAPITVSSALKTAVFTAKMMEKLGYKAVPSSNEKRADIVQTIEFGNPEDLIRYCQGIQMGSPIDSDVIPYPGDMGGYEDKVIMAAGTFTQGSTIELSCDGPIRKPYIAYMQGGLTYEYGKLGILKAIEQMKK